MSLQVQLKVQRERFSLEVDFETATGNVVGIVGPNGSGKSTLIAAIAGHLTISDGFVKHGDTIFDDTNSGVSVAPENRDIGLVHQHGLLFPHMSVEKNVAFAIRGGSRSLKAEMTRSQLQKYQLENLAKRKPSELSAGQAQRVAVARSTIAKPALLLLDEPLARVDIEQRRLLRTTIAESKPPGQIQIVATHGPEHARQVDVLLALEAGQVVAQGSPKQLAQSPILWLRELLDN